ncbi:hypothetical protein LINPERPRIM_LOCUS26096 [Linum perenne]
MLQQKKDKQGRAVTTMSRTGMKMRCSLCKGEGHNRRKCSKMNNAGFADLDGTRERETGGIDLNINPGEEGASETINLNASVLPEGKSNSPRAGASLSGFTFIPNLSRPRTKLGVQRGRGDRMT